MNTVRKLKRLLRGTSAFAVYSRVKDRVLDGLPPGPERNAFYDRQTIAVMSRVLRRDSNCIDIGAHSGAILRHMVTLAPDGIHYAFEPLPHMAGVLRERFPGVRVVEAAVGDRCGTSDFHHVANDPGYSGLRRRVYDCSEPDIRVIPVRVETLDAVIPLDHPVAFLKMDIEGGEFHALQGGASMIRRCNPVIVFEAAEISTGQYAVDPKEFYDLVTNGLGGYALSTMTRWFRRWPPLTVKQFCNNWTNGPNFYFIAIPTPGRTSSGG